MAVFSAFSRYDAFYILILCLLIYVIKALPVYINSVHFALLVKGICRCKRISSCAAPVIKNDRFRHVKDRCKQFCTLCLLPVVYIIENTHGSPASPHLCRHPKMPLGCLGKIFILDQENNYSAVNNTTANDQS